MIKLKSGFTLIELLVVIAVIGILSAVVLGQLNSARSKGADSSIRSNLNNIINVAWLIYDLNNETWGQVCGDSRVTKMLTAAGGACVNGNTTGWRATAPLTIPNQFSGSSGTDYWCVDYNNTKKLCDNNPSGLSGGYYVCPASC